MGWVGMDALTQIIGRCRHIAIGYEPPIHRARWIAKAPTGEGSIWLPQTEENG